MRWMAKILYEEVQACTGASLEDKSLVSHIPPQVFECNDESFDDLKGVDFVEKPLEVKIFLGAPTASCEE